MHILVYANGFDKVYAYMLEKNFQFNYCSFLMVVNTMDYWEHVEHFCGTHHSSESQHRTMKVLRELS